MSPSSIEIIEEILRSLAFVVLYFFLGFGPGFALGILLANSIFGRGKPVLYKVHKDNITNAAQHNAQWNPSHERWRQ